MRRKTRRASEIIGELGLDPNQAYDFIYEQGMLPQSLTQEDIERLRSLGRNQPVQRTSVLTESDLKGATILVLSDDKERINIYWLHGVPQTAPGEIVPLDELYKAIEGRFEDFSSFSITDLLRTGSAASGRGGPGTGGRRITGRGTNYREFLTRTAYDYILEHLNELRQYAHMADQPEEHDISENESMKQLVTTDELRQNFGEVGFRIKRKMKPADLVAQAAQKAKKKVARDVKSFVDSKDGEFLEGFPIERLNSINGTRDAIRWLEQHGGGKDTAFYVHCLEFKYRGKFNREEGEKVGQTWAHVANNNKFTRNHAWAQKELPKKATGEEFGVLIARHYAEHPDHYHSGDATRLFDGLYVDGRITDVHGITNARRTYGGPVNYLLMNFDDVDNIMHSVVERIRKQDVKDGKHRSVYRKIKNGTLAIDRSNVGSVRMVIDESLLPHEKSSLEKMYPRGKDPSIFQTYRQRIFDFYLQIRGDALFRY